MTSSNLEPMKEDGRVVGERNDTMKRQRNDYLGEGTKKK